jgi:penicillin amidase
MDVQDLYVERLISFHRIVSVKARGPEANYGKIIHVKGQPEPELESTVTRHGPSWSARDKSLRCGGLQRNGRTRNNYNLLGKRETEGISRNHEACGDRGERSLRGRRRQHRMRDGGASADSKKGHGEVPVPGDTDDYEWTGYIPFEQLPQALNPASGLIVSANARVVGPLYKPYLTDRWEEPYRTARIYDLLHDRHDLRPEDMLKVQTDTYSYPNAFLSDQLAAAAKWWQDPRQKRRRSGVGMIADAESPEVSFLHAARRMALDLLLEPFPERNESLSVAGDVLQKPLQTGRQNGCRLPTEL